MNRERAINIIKNLYPADSPFPGTAQIGMELLTQARSNLINWRHEPTKVLVLYALLCEQYEKG